MNTTALYTAITLTVAYAIYVVVRYGWQKSYSDTYYTQPLGWIFQAWCFALSLLIFVSFYKAAPAILVSSFGFVVVGFAPKMRESWQEDIHFIGAVLTMVGGCWALMQLHLASGLISTVILAIAAIVLMLWKPKNYFFWLETMAFAVIFGLSVYLT